MCLSKAYGLREDGSENLLVDYVTKVKLKDNEIELQDLLGGTHLIRGKLTEIDLEKNLLYIVLD